MYAITKEQAFQVIGFNKDGSQQILCRANSLMALLSAWAKELPRFVASGADNILPSFSKITVWNVDEGFTGFDLPYIQTV